MALQSIFGAGYLFATPSGGYPVMFATLQEVSVDISFDAKMLHGQGAFPIAQGRGKGKLEAKATTGRIDPVLFNSVFFGQTIATGQTLGSMGEAASVPTTPYQITVANAAQFRKDLGVYDTVLGKFLTRVSSAPATGQYSVNEATGVYTFAAADTGKAVKTYYSYGSATTGKTITVSNPDMGTAPTFRADLINQYNGKTASMILHACQSFKLGMALKLDDFALPNFEFSAFDDGTGTVFTMSASGDS